MKFFKVLPKKNKILSECVKVFQLSFSIIKEF